MLTQIEIQKIFEETGAIMQGHFCLASGKHSDTYMQCAKLFKNPSKSQILCKELANKIKRIKNIDIQCVASPAIGGIIMGYEMASQLSVCNIFLERIEGNLVARRGFDFEKGTKFLVVEDVVTTGGSVVETIKELERLGGEVVAVASIVDRSNGNADFLRPYISLYTADVIAYDANSCPLCKEGIPITKPGTKALTNM